MTPTVIDRVRSLETAALSSGVDFCRWEIVGSSMQQIDPADDVHERLECSSKMRVFLGTYGVVTCFNGRLPGTIDLCELLTAEDKLQIPVGSYQSANDNSIIAAGPLVREGQGFMPFRIVLRVWKTDENGEAVEYVSHKQIIPDGSGTTFRPSFDHGQYITSYEEALKLWTLRVLDPDGITPKSFKTVHIWVTSRAEFYKFSEHCGERHITVPVTWELRSDNEKGVVLVGPKGYEATATQVLEMARNNTMGFRLKDVD